MVPNLSKGIVDKLKKRVVEAPELRFSEVGNVLRLHLNECLYSPPPFVVEAINRAAQQINLYPNVDMFNRLRELLARYSGVDADMAYPFPSAGDALKNLFYIFADPGDTVLLLKPTFSSIEQYATVYGLRKVFVELKECGDMWCADVDKLVELAKTSDLVVIDDPNNPTGSPVLGGRKEVIARLAESAKGFVVVDETYHEFCNYTAASMVREYPNIVIVRSMSKAFCMAGARLGYVIAHPDVVRNLAKIAIPFDTSSTALAAGIAALEHTDYFMNIVEKLKKARDRVFAELKAMGIRVYKSYTNFLLIRDSRPLDKLFMERGVAIRRFGPDIYRISIGSEEAAEKVIQIFKELKTSQNI